MSGLFEVEILKEIPESNPGFLPWNLIRLQNQAHSIGRIRRIHKSKPIELSKSTTGSAFMLIQKYSQKFSYPLNGFVFSLLTGNRNQLSSTLVKIFQQAGIAHILALSGLHFSIIFTLLHLILKMLFASKSFRIILLIFFNVLYLYAIGWKISMIRASVMGILIIFVLDWQIKTKMLHLFTLTVFIFLVVNPLVLFNISFQLSFSAILGIFIYTLVRDRFPIKVKAGLTPIRKIIDMLLATICIQLFTLPFQIYYFHQVSVMAIINNLWCLPLFSLLFIFMLLDLVLIQFTPLAIFLNHAIHLIFNLMLVLLKYSIPLNHLSAFSIPNYFSILPAFLLILFILKIERRVKVILLAIFLLLPSIIHYYSKSRVRFITFDMGQANAQLISYNDQHILIDCGRDLFRQQPYYYLTNFLKALKVDTLDAVFITHADQDHSGQIKFLLNNIPIKKIYLPLSPPGKFTSSKITFLKRGDSLKIGNLSFVCLWPEEMGISGNHQSMVGMIRLKEKNFLFTGDIPSLIFDQLTQYLQNNTKIDFLNIPHHGSKSSLSREFYRQFNIQNGIISCGDQNFYGHPSSGVINILNQAGITIKRTDKNGCIKFFY